MLKSISSVPNSILDWPELSSMFFPLDLEREHHIEINVCFNLVKFLK